MDPMNDDPLVLFLKKATDDTADEQPPLTGLVDGDQLKDNLGNMPLGKEVHERTSLSPSPTSRMHDKVKSDTYSTVEEMFSNGKSMSRKCYDKDHAIDDDNFDPGVVDRVLGL